MAAAHRCHMQNALHALHVHVCGIRVSVQVSCSSGMTPRGYPVTASGHPGHSGGS